MIWCQNPTRLLRIFRCDTARWFYFLWCLVIHQESLLIAIIVRLVHFSYDLACRLGVFYVIDDGWGEIFGAVGIRFRPLKFPLDANGWSMALIVLQKLETGGLFSVGIILGQRLWIFILVRSVDFYFAGLVMNRIRRWVPSLAQMRINQSSLRSFIAICDRCRLDNWSFL